MGQDDILGYLSKHKNKDFTIKQLSNTLKVNPSVMCSSLNKLHKRDKVFKRTFLSSNTIFWKFKQEDKE